MRIPTGNFGNAPQRADPIQTASPRQLDGGMSQALAGVGAAAEGLTNTLQAQEAQRQDEARRIAAQEAHAQKQARDAADKATATAKMGQGRDAIADLQAEFEDGIVTGQIDKTKAAAEWKKRAAEAIKLGVDGVPEAHLATVQNDLNAQAMRSENKIGRAVMLRDRTDTLAGIDQTLEYAQRLSTTDPAKGRQYGLDTIDQLGPFAGLNADQIGKKKQAFVEGVSYTRAYTAINVSRTDNQSLRAVDAAVAADNDLDPQKKAQLLNTSAGYQAHNDQRAEMAAQRAQRVADANLKRAEVAFNVFQTTADKGGAIDPAYVEQVSRLTAGTPYQAGIKALAQQAVETGGIAAQPIAAQRSALDAIDRQINATGRNPELDKRRAQIEKVYTASQQDAKNDPMRAGQERGVIAAIEPLDMSSPQGIAGSMSKRVVQAQQVSAWVGQPVSPLTGDEADKLRDTLGKLQPKQRSEAIATLTAAMGPGQATGLATQMDSKDKALALAFATGASATSAGRYTSELILKGAAAEKDGTSTKGEKTPGVKASQWKSHISVTAGGMFPDATLNAKVQDSALYIAHAIASEKGGDLNANDLERAVALAVGGPVIEHNGVRIPLPADSTADMLEQRLKNTTGEQIRAQAGGDTVRAGGVQVPVADFAKSLPGARLMPVKPGKYAVMVNDRPVTGANGKAVLVGF